MGEKSTLLSNLLAAVILVVAIFVGCISYGLSFTMQTNLEIYYVVVGLNFLFLILLTTAVGFLQRRKWARVTLLYLLYLIFINWTILAYFWASNIMWRRDGIEKFVPVIFSIGVYLILVGAILLVRHPKLKAEFDG